MPYLSEKAIAIAATRTAAHLCQQVRQDLGSTAMEKKDRSPVTVADFGAQALICQALAANFPQDPVVAEEDATELRQPAMAQTLSQVTHYVHGLVPEATNDAVADWIDHGNGDVGPRYWTLDPIDGTKGFVRGDQYAIALALVEAGEVKVGTLACPALTLKGHEGVLFVAVRGAGAVVMPLDRDEAQPIAVASSGDLNALRFVESVEASHGNPSHQATIAQAVGITQASLRMDSQAKYGAVAAGEAVLYLRLPSPKSPHYREKIWDHAAGTIVVEEAGGRVTDMDGNLLDFSQGAKLVNNRGVVVSNGTLHPRVLDALI